MRMSTVLPALCCKRPKHDPARFFFSGVLADTACMSRIASSWVALGLLAGALSAQRPTPAPPKPAAPPPQAKPETASPTPNAGQGPAAGRDAAGRNQNTPKSKAEAPRPQAPSDEATAAAEDVASKYFELADLDHNQWVLFSEAEKTMGLDRQAFAAFDFDLDFRISLAEFRRRYEEITTRGGAFPAPRSETAAAAQTAELGAKDLLAQYDSNGDDAIDEAELRSMLLRLERTKLDPQVVMIRLDRDGDRTLAKEEVEDLARFLDPKLSKTVRSKARSIEELFGKSIPRKEREGAIRLPAQIPGPVDTFRRLDANGDGRIREAELADLLRPVQTAVRLSAVFATLDKNGDGALNSEEFWSALGR